MHGSAPKSVTSSSAAAMSFTDSAKRFVSFIGRLRHERLPPANGPHVGVIVGPWSSTLVPWFAIALGALLRHRGLRVTLLWNDLRHDPGDAEFASESAFVGAFLGRLAGLKCVMGFEVVRLGAQAAVPLDADARDFVAREARSNAIWLNRSSLPIEQVNDLTKAMSPLLGQNLAHVHGLFESHSFDFVVAPGGMYGNSGLFLRAAEQRGVRVVTYDGRPRGMTLGLRGAASRYPDVADCVRRADELLGADVDRARALARARMAERMNGDERYFAAAGHVGETVQLISAVNDRASYGEDVVIPLNVEWDTAAVGLHRFYQDDREWLERTVGHLLEHTRLRVTVRQHPGTRIYREGADAMAQALVARFGGHPRFRFIAGEEPANSYNLLSAARVVLPHSSTIGIEAAMMGRPVVTCSRSYYAELPFADDCHDEGSYFDRIVQHATRHSTQPDEHVSCAELTYFFAACANLIDTCFTPYAEDFDHWCGLSLDELAGDPGVQTMLRVMLDDVPAAALQAKARLTMPSTPTATVSMTSTSHYGPTRINATTLARIAAAPRTWAEILAFHESLASDDYVRYVDGFYRDNIARYGEHWHYLDIVNVLYAASKALQPKRYLEVGVRRGRSACAVARGCPTVDIVASDMWVANYAGMENPGPSFVTEELKRHGHRGALAFMDGDSHVLLPKLFAKRPDLQFDLITIDGDHSEAGAYRDLCDVVPHLAPGGVLVFDDISHPTLPHLLGVWRKVVEEHPGLSAYEYVEQGYGVAFAVRAA